MKISEKSPYSLHYSSRVNAKILAEPIMIATRRHVPLILALFLLGWLKKLPISCYLQIHMLDPMLLFTQKCILINPKLIATLYSQELRLEILPSPNYRVCEAIGNPAKSNHSHHEGTRRHCTVSKTAQCATMTVRCPQLKLHCRLCMRTSSSYYK